ncbi:transglycosylase SLT domain-containing protein [Glutamicibacter sp. PAEs-4]|uniref:transglycosylase SLT domain-containing protein n=1 Tax=Glutamicibacter sp. PAEs-4 TaxID=3444114 RepID=UPI003EB8D834
MKIPAQYREAVEKSADTAGLPIGIIAAQINQESGWNPKAVSPVGARGIAQFMPETWEEWGNGKDPFDPFAGLDAQGRYMKYLAGEIADLTSNEKEKIQFTLAAYNAGAGNVQKYGGISRPSRKPATMWKSSWATPRWTIPQTAKSPVASISGSCKPMNGHTPCPIHA